MADLMRYMPELTGEEAQYVGGLLSNMTDEQAANFTFAYRGQRRVETTFIVLSIFSIGRFYLGQIGMGILYVCTGSLCFVGGIADLLNHKKILAKHNREIAQRVATTSMPMGFNPFSSPMPYVPSQTPPAAPVPTTAPEPPPAPPQAQEQPEVQPVEIEPQAEPEQEPAPKPQQSAPSETLSTSDMFEALERLAALHERGVLTDEEFQAQKDRLLNS